MKAWMYHSHNTFSAASMSFLVDDGSLSRWIFLYCKVFHEKTHKKIPVLNKNQVSP